LSRANLAAALARAGRLAEARQRLQGARHPGAPRRGGAGSPLYGRGERQAGAHTRRADLLARFTEGFDTARSAGGAPAGCSLSTPQSELVRPD